MLPLRSVNIALSQLSRRLSLRSIKVPILKKQQSTDMRKSVSTWIFGRKQFLSNTGPSARGKPNFRGSIIGEEGMETPLPNDSSKASLSPPVGGRLHSFRRDWQTNKCSPNVLNIITNGYVLPFLSKPNLVRFPLILSEYKAHQKDQTLASCIQSLLSKNAIERVKNVKSLGFYSCLFLVPKPHQRWRPVIDLSRLNTFLHIEKFKMETPESIRTSHSRGVGIVDRSVGRFPTHPHPSKLKEIPKVLLHVTGVPVHLPPIRTSHRSLQWS